MILALTGATGFVGGHVVARALTAGHRVRALTRRPRPARDGVEWVAGALDRPDGLAELARGADAVIHMAGVLTAPDRAGFAAGNVEGTGNLVGACAPGLRFVHVSSLAAREPALSDYGWSKAGGERVVAACALDWVTVRPPGVYGPGDTEMRDLFRAARWRVMPMPPPGRASLVYAPDLARLLVSLAEGGPSGVVLEPDDGEPLTHAELARRIGRAVGLAVLPVPLPAPLLRLAARVDGALRGRAAKLTPDRARYLSHRDWAADPARRPDPALWRAEVGSAKGLTDTARWYRAHGLL